MTGFIVCYLRYKARPHGSHSHLPPHAAYTADRLVTPPHVARNPMFGGMFSPEGSPTIVGTGGGLGLGRGGGARVQLYFPNDSSVNTDV